MFPQEEGHKGLKVLAVEARGRLRMARLQEDKVCLRLQDMERQLQFVQQDLKELLIKLHRAKSLERQAASAVSWLESKIVNWKAAAQVTLTIFHFICLIKFHCCWQRTIFCLILCHCPFVF